MGNDKANVRLMAQSPDYFAGVAKMILNEQSGGDGWWEGWAMLKAAHAKALGIAPVSGAAPDDNGGPVVIVACIGGPWEWVGELVRRSGDDDGSGVRRAVMGALERGDLGAVSRILLITVEEAAELRARIVAEWGEPEREGS